MITAKAICLDDRPGALAEPLFHVAKAKANVMTINHTRNIRGIPLGRVYIDLELETRGRDPIYAVDRYLRKQGYRINSIWEEEKDDNLGPKQQKT